MVSTQQLTAEVADDKALNEPEVDNTEQVVIDNVKDEAHTKQAEINNVKEESQAKVGL